MWIRAGERQQPARGEQIQWGEQGLERPLARRRQERVQKCAGAVMGRSQAEKEPAKGPVRQPVVRAEMEPPRRESLSEKQYWADRLPEATAEPPWSSSEEEVRESECREGLPFRPASLRESRSPEAKQLLAMGRNTGRMEWTVVWRLV